MDFGTLLSTAQRNEHGGKKEIKYYSTKFEPPKKEQRNKTLSVNIRNFLAKKEAEERRKNEKETKKRDELLALRAKDKKATRRVNVMLKRTKSANQSVIQDAVDQDNTAVTLAGPSQPDEDDYGYVSQEAAAFYNKMMEKYSKMPDEPKFSLTKTKKVSSTNLSSTKDRVKAALEREKEEAMMPHKRKRKHKEEGVACVEEVQEEKAPEEPKPKPKPKPAPPPIMNFAELLKVAEKKQHEPIVIEQKVVKDDERPLTKKQKKEMEFQRQWRERKEKGLTGGGPAKPPPPPSDKNNKVDNKAGDGKLKIEGRSLNDRVPKIDSKPPVNFKSSKDDFSSRTPKMQPQKINNPSAAVLSSTNRIPAKAVDVDRISSNKTMTLSSHKTPDKFERVNSSNGHKSAIKPVSSAGSSLKTSTKPILPSLNKATIGGEKFQKPNGLSASGKQTALKEQQRQKQFPPADVHPKHFPPKDVKPKQFLPPADLKPKQFPPADVRRREPVKQKTLAVKKGRILDDDDEEYDSEMDDFIDDGPLDQEDYSKYISEIFGYDKSKYRHVDDDDVDNMESSFAQQMKEEVISTKIGIMEDLEDMRKEEEEKRRKALMKKRCL